MVCVKSVKHLLDVFILPGEKRKVNQIVESFTICLQDYKKQTVCS